jgi:hypothetical protein
LASPTCARTEKSPFFFNTLAMAILHQSKNNDEAFWRAFRRGVNSHSHNLGVIRDRQASCPADRTHANLATP